MAGKTHTFIVSDEAVINSYGSRIMTAGIDIAQYKRNPVVLWYHHRPTKWDSKQSKETEALPIGKSVKLWKEDGQLKAEIEFDEEDDFAMKIEGKVSRGFINMCSPGVEPVTISEDAKYLLPGQLRATVVKSALEEISIVDIGGNNNALRLSHDPSQNIDEFLPLVKYQSNSQTQMNEFQQKVAMLLGLDQNAAPESVMSALTAKITLAKEADDYKLKHDTLKAEVTAMNDGRIIALVDANQDKKFTADKRETFISLGKSSGYETLKNVLDATPSMVKPGDIIDPKNTSAGGDDPNNKLTFAKLREQGADAVEKYRKEKRESYITLFKEEYGYSPEID
ncbi:MAG: hypothetical protein Q8O72_10590 [Bacteroidales bacterium]|nr:hypothetical protein [Bacteroidales bacterium]